MILTVYLSDGEQAVTEVPITPETTCRDVVEFCKEPGESGCHLAEVWRGNGKSWVTFRRLLRSLFICCSAQNSEQRVQRSVLGRVKEGEQRVSPVMHEGKVI